MKFSWCTKIAIFFSEHLMLAKVLLEITQKSALHFESRRYVKEKKNNFAYPFVQCILELRLHDFDLKIFPFIAENH